MAKRIMVKKEMAERGRVKRGIKENGKMKCGRWSQYLCATEEMSGQERLSDKKSTYKGSQEEQSRVAADPGDSPIIPSSTLISMTTTRSSIGDVTVMNIHQVYELSTESFPLILHTLMVLLLHYILMIYKSKSETYYAVYTTFNHKQSKITKNSEIKKHISHFA